MAAGGVPPVRHAPAAETARDAGRADPIFCPKKSRRAVSEAAQSDMWRRAAEQSNVI
jgi:hypothetical protein